MLNEPAGGSAEEQVIQQDPVVSGETTPEMWIDEKGDFHALLKDWEGVGGEAEKQEQEVDNSESSEEQKYYTSEELDKLRLDEIDLSKVDPAYRPYYEALINEYLKRKSEQPKEKKDTLDENIIYEHIQAEALRRVEQKLGERFDELNPKHVAALALEVSLLSSQVQKVLELQQKIKQMQQDEPFFEEIDKYATEKIQSLPYREVLSLRKAVETGDYAKLLEFWEKCRKEFYNQKLTQVRPQEQVKQNPEPPKVETPGKGETVAKKVFNPKDFARMSDEEKAQALIELGLV